MSDGAGNADDGERRPRFLKGHFDPCGEGSGFSFERKPREEMGRWSLMSERRHCRRREEQEEEARRREVLEAADRKKKLGILRVFTNIFKTQNSTLFQSRKQKQHGFLYEETEIAECLKLVSKSDHSPD